MNNNRNSQNTSNTNNNRRRGRGNNNRPQGGNGGGRGEQLNRIDSRARGNAPQMLEKYKKLASDAHLNGDRVQAEYYLQFADHYFRVIADQRLRQEEQRSPRDPRQDGGEPYRQDEGDGDDYGNEGDFPGYDQQANNYRPEPREQREPRPEPREPREPRPDQRNEAREVREPREPREFREQPRETQEQAPPQRPRAEIAAEAAEATEPSEAAGGNPFTRNENRGTRGLRPRREPRAPREPSRAEARDDAVDSEPMGLDPALLPPAIAESREAAPAPDDLVDAVVETPAPRRRGRPRRVVGDEPVEAVNG